MSFTNTTQSALPPSLQQVPIPSTPLADNGTTSSGSSTAGSDCSNSPLGTPRHRVLKGPSLHHSASDLLLSASSTSTVDSVYEYLCDDADGTTAALLDTDDDEYLCSSAAGPTSASAADLLALSQTGKNCIPFCSSLKSQLDSPLGLVPGTLLTHPHSAHNALQSALEDIFEIQLLSESSLADDEDENDDECLDYQCNDQPEEPSQDLENSLSEVTLNNDDDDEEKLLPKHKLSRSPSLLNAPWSFYSGPQAPAPAAPFCSAPHVYPPAGASAAAWWTDSSADEADILAAYYDDDDTTDSSCAPTPCSATRPFCLASTLIKKKNTGSTIRNHASPQDAPAMAASPSHTQAYHAASAILSSVKQRNAVTGASPNWVALRRLHDDYEAAFVHKLQPTTNKQALTSAAVAAAAMAIAAGSTATPDEDFSIDSPVNNDEDDSSCYSSSGCSTSTDSANYSPVFYMLSPPARNASAYHALESTNPYVASSSSSASCAKTTAIRAPPPVPARVPARVPAQAPRPQTYMLPVAVCAGSVERAALPGPPLTRVLAVQQRIQKNSQTSLRARRILKRRMLEQQQQQLLRGPMVPPGLPMPMGMASPVPVM